MTVHVRPYRRGGWEVDIRIRLDDGRSFRERRKSPVTSKSGSMRWGQDRERHLLKHGTGGPADQIERKVPTLAEFAPRYIEGYVKANRLKPSTLNNREYYLREHLLPVLGHHALDEFGDEHVGVLRAARARMAPHSVNLIVAFLQHMLKMAAKWKLCPPRQWETKPLRVTKKQVEFYEFDELGKLIASAGAVGAEAKLIVLLAGDAGLRRGEMVALEWGTVDLRRKLLEVCQADWEGHIGTTKGDRPRTIPMTDRLAKALASHRHLVGPRVLYRLVNGEHVPHNASSLAYLLHKAQAGADLPPKGPHKLRHSFCSHLAMRGVPARTIQELAGHADLSTTQGYMHLSPTALRHAIDVLEQPEPGGMGETLAGAGEKSSEHK